MRRKRGKETDGERERERRARTEALAFGKIHVLHSAVPQKAPFHFAFRHAVKSWTSRRLYSLEAPSRDAKFDDDIVMKCWIEINRRSRLIIRISLRARARVREDIKKERR